MDFEEELSLEIENLELKLSYNLIGIICHYGVSCAGHYITFFKEKNIWFEFNDTVIEQISFSNVLNRKREVMILLYERNNNKY